VTLDFHVTIDVSGFCLGAILWQEYEPRLENMMYYASKQMSLAERKYSAMERKALGIIYACMKYRHYLLGYKTIFHTDHDALKHLVNKLDLSGRIARWIILLQEFNYEVQVKPGKSNSNADYFSRMQGERADADVDMEFPDEFPEIVVEVNAVGSCPWHPTYKQAFLHVEELIDPGCTNLE
jgi:hypothetical protein